MSRINWIVRHLKDAVKREADQELKGYLRAALNLALLDRQYSRRRHKK